MCAGGKRTLPLIATVWKRAVAVSTMVGHGDQMHKRQSLSCQECKTRPAVGTQYIWQLSGC